MQNANYGEYLDRYPIAMAYVPWQHFTSIYENLEEAFQAGTIFPELNKPFYGRKGMRG